MFSAVNAWRSGGEPAEIRLHGRRIRGQDRPQTGHITPAGNSPTENCGAYAPFTSTSR